jgi:uncharacterized membrane protein YjgN (DUF898 family)
VSIQAKPLEFKGHTSEYFGIWLSNLLLTIVTMGIYSAWAKVRRKQYFYNNTFLEQANFGYHATGIQILKGRLLFLTGFIALNLLATFFPAVYGLVGFVFFFLGPYLINLSLQFNARSTSYRNVRFHFEGDYLEAFLAYIVMPFLSIITLGLLAPVAVRFLLNYVWSRVSYGGHSIDTHLSLTDFYKLFGISVILPVTSLFVLASVLFSLSFIQSDSGISDNYAIASIAPFLFALYLYIFFVGFVYRIFCMTLLFKGIAIEGAIHFSNTIHPGRLLLILITNFLAIIFSLGLLIPWAQIRQHRYITEHIATYASTDFDEFVADAVEKQSAFGEEFADFDGVDLGL